MSEVSEKASEMSAEATALLREIASPVPVKVALNQVARELKGWSPNRIRDVFHADPRVRVDEAEMAELRAAAQRKREAAGAAEYRVLKARLDRIEAFLRASGANVDLPGDDLERGDAR